jgi:hypothetical protein
MQHRGIWFRFPAARVRDLSLLHSVQAVSGPTLPHSTQCVQRLFLRRLSDRSVKLTTHHHLVKSVENGGAIPLVSICAYTGPEQCSLAWVIVNEFCWITLDSNFYEPLWTRVAEFVFSGQLRGLIWNSNLVASRARDYFGEFTSGGAAWEARSNILGNHLSIRLKTEKKTKKTCVEMAGRRTSGYTLTSSQQSGNWRVQRFP